MYECNFNLNIRSTVNITVYWTIYFPVCALGLFLVFSWHIIMLYQNLGSWIHVLSFWKFLSSCFWLALRVVLGVGKYVCQPEVCFLKCWCRRLKTLPPCFTLRNILLKEAALWAGLFSLWSSWEQSPRSWELGPELFSLLVSRVSQMLVTSLDPEHRGLPSCWWRGADWRA